MIILIIAGLIIIGAAVFWGIGLYTTVKTPRLCRNSGHDHTTYNHWSCSRNFNE